MLTDLCTHLPRHEVVGDRRQVEGEGHRQGRPQHPAPRARGLQLVCPDNTRSGVTFTNCCSIKTYFSNLVCSRTCSWTLWSSAFFSDICFLRELKSVKILKNFLYYMRFYASFDQYLIIQDPLKIYIFWYLYRALSLSPPVMAARASLTSSSLDRVSLSSSLIGHWSRD